MTCKPTGGVVSDCSRSRPPPRREARGHSRLPPPAVCFPFPVLLRPRRGRQLGPPAHCHVPEAAGPGPRRGQGCPPLRPPPRRVDSCHLPASSRGRPLCPRHLVTEGHEPYGMRVHPSDFRSPRSPPDGPACKRGHVLRCCGQGLLLPWGQNVTAHSGRAPGPRGPTSPLEQAGHRAGGPRPGQRQKSRQRPQGLRCWRSVTGAWLSPRSESFTPSPGATWGPSSAHTAVT